MPLPHPGSEEEEHLPLALAKIALPAGSGEQNAIVDDPTVGNALRWEKNVRDTGQP